MSKISGIDLGNISSGLELRLDKFETSITSALQGFYKLQTRTQECSSIMDKSVYTAISNIEKSYKLWEDANNSNGKSLDDNSKRIEACKSSIGLLDAEIKKSEKILEDIEKQCGENSREYENYKSHVLDLKLKHAELSNELQKTSKNTYTVAEHMARLDESYKKTSLQISNVEKNYRLFDLTQEKTGKGIFDNSKKVDSLKREMDLLEDTLKKHESLLKVVEHEYGKNSKEAEEYRAKVLDLKISHAELGGELKKVEKETTTLAGKFEILGREFEKIDDKYRVFDTVGNKLQGIGNNLTMGVTLPIVGATVAAGKFAMDFESGAAKISTIADTTKMSMDQLKRGVVNLSNEAGLSTKDLNEGLYETLSAGVDTAKSIDFLSVAVKAAKGGFTDTATSVDGLTSVLNSYGITADKANEIANQMLICQNLGKTTFGELASQMGEITPITAALGVETNELLSSLAATTGQGLQTSKSVTGLKAAMSNIIKPSKEAKEASDALGISFNVSTLQTKGWMPFLQEVKEGLKNASPEFAKISEQIDVYTSRMVALEKQGQKGSKEYKQLSKNVKGLNKDLELMAQASDSTIGGFATMFGSVEGLNSILMLTSENGMNLYNESMRQMTENTGALDDAYNKMSETTETKFQKALNKGKNSLMELGVKALPLFEKGIDFLSKLIDKFNNLSPSTQEWVLKIGLATAALGPFLSLTGGAVQTLGGLLTLGPKVKTFFGLFKGASTIATTTKAISEVGTAAGAAAKGFSLAGAAAKLGALALNPWVLGAAAVGVAGYGIYKVLDQEVVPKMDLFEDAVISSTGALNGIVDSKGRVNSSLSMMGNSMSEYGQIVGSTVVKISEGTKKAVGAYMKLDKDVSTSLFNIRINSTKTADQVKVDMVKKFNETSNLCGDVSKDMKEKLNKEFIGIYAGSSGMTEQMKNDMSAKMKEMLDSSKLLSEEQKNKIISEYEAMYNDSGLITEQWKNELTTKYNEMGQQIKDGLKSKQDESIKDIQDYFFNSNALTVEEEAKIMQAEKDSWEGRKGAVDVYTKEINDIISKAYAEKGKLDDADFKRIDELQKLMKTEAVKALSETEIESKVILERIKGNSERLTSDQASDAVKKAHDVRDKTIKAAEEEYDKRVGWIIKQRDETGKLTAEQADKLIQEAERTRKDSVQKANDMCEGIKTEIEKGSPGIWEKVDKQNGGIIRGYTKLKNEIGGFFKWLFNSIGEGANALENLGKDTPNNTGKPIGAKAVGTSFWEGGLTWINEEGKELLELPSNGARLTNLPRGTKIYNASDSHNMKKRMMQPNREDEIESYTQEIKVLNTSSKNIDKQTSTSTDGLKEQLDADIKVLKDALYKLQQEDEKALRTVRGRNKQALRDSIKDQYEVKKKAVKDQIELKKEETNTKIEEIKRLGKVTKEQFETEKQQLKEKQDILKKELEARKLFAKNVNDLSDNIVNALKEKYSQESKLKEEYIQKEISDLEKSKDSELKDLEETYTSEREYLDLSSKEEEENLQDELNRWDKWKDNAVDNIESTYDSKKRALEESERVSEKVLEAESDRLDKWNETTEKNIEDTYEVKERALEDAERASEKAFEAENDRLDKWKEQQLYSIEEVSNAKIKSLQDEINSLEQNEKQSDRAEMDREELTKINRLKEQLPYEHNDFNKGEIEKEIAKLEAERVKRLNKEALEDKKENLKKQIDAIQEDADKQKEIINSLYENNKEDLKKRIEDSKEYYRVQNQQLEDAKTYELESLKVIYERNKETLKKKIDNSKEYYRLEKQELDDAKKYELESIENVYDRNKEMLERKLKDSKEYYDSEKRALERNYKESRELLETQYAEKKETLENELEDIKDFYEEKTKEANLNAEAEKLIMNNNQKEIVQLLNSYGKEYKAVGRTLGERLLDGFEPAINDIRGLMDSVNSEISYARNNALRAMRDLEKLNEQTSEYEGYAQQIKNEYNVHIVSPYAQTPSQQRREMESTLRRLGYAFR